MLVDQMKEMRRENRELRNEVGSLKELHQDSERRLRWLQEESKANREQMTTLLSVWNENTLLLRGGIPQAPRSVSFDFSDLFSKSAFYRLLPRARALVDVLPFLENYLHEASVLDDLR